MQQSATMWMDLDYISWVKLVRRWGGTETEWDMNKHSKEITNAQRQEKQKEAHHAEIGLEEGALGQQ